MADARNEMEHAFFAGHRSPTTPFVVNDSVEVIAGPHASRRGAVISIDTSAPEVQLRVELENGHDVLVRVQDIRLVDAER
jgi:transcription antitermination factor NusG